MSEEELYHRRIRIKGGITGHFVDVTDLDTGKQVPGVVCAVIYLNPRKVNEAELTYLAMDEQGKVLLRGEEPYAEPIVRKIRVDHPEVDLLAFERLNARVIYHKEGDA